MKRTQAKAISYLRFSTPKQGDEGRDSYRRQAALAEEWCRRNRVPLETDLRFQDLGVSAYRGKNATFGALSAILAEIGKPNGRIRPGDYLLVEQIDRISRMEPLDAFDLCRKIVEAGITIVTVATGQTYSRESLNSGDGSVYVLLGAIQAAHDYSKRLGLRIAHSYESRRQLMSNGKKTRHACPRWLEWDDAKKQYVPIQDRAAIARRIYELVLAGATVGEVIRILENDKVPCWSRSGGWKMTAPSLLSSPEVTGLRVVTRMLRPEEIKDPGVQKVELSRIDDYYPAIVTREEYDTARRMLEDRSFWKRGHARKDLTVKVTNIFSGKLRCAACGDSLTIQSSGNKRGGYLRYATCRTHRETRSCRGKTSVNYDAFESKLLYYMSKELTASELLADQSSKSEIVRLANAIADRRSALGVAEQKAERLARSLADDELTDAARRRVIGMLNKAEADAESIAKEIDNLQEEAERLQGSLSSADECLRDVTSYADSRDDGGRARLRDAISQLVESIEVDTTASPGRCREPRYCIKFRTGLERDVFVASWEMPAIGMAARVPVERRRVRVVERDSGAGKRSRTLGEMIAAGEILDDDARIERLIAEHEQNR